MTIYKPKNGVDRKLGTKLEKSPGVVLVGDDATPLTEEHDKGDSNGVLILRNYTQKFERNFMRVCTVAAILSIFIFAACFGYFIHQKMSNYKPAIQTIHVQFHEYRRRVDQDDMTESRIEGGFYEQAEVDWKMERYEKLNIPPFIDSRRSTVVHDFKYDLTAIVDHDEARCFTLPLNRTIVIPPGRFMEGISRFRAGHSFPNARVERQVYQVVTPPVADTLSYGEVIAADCKFYPTFKLVKANEPIAMSKRFDCQFSGLTYSLGETGYPLMVLVTLEGCA